jgi:hypothetical protein
MSDNVLRIIPRNPEYVPDEKNFKQVLIRIAELVYDYVPEEEFNIKKWTDKSAQDIQFFSNSHETLKIEISPYPQFIDNGCNLETICCPYCESNCDFAWWTHQVDIAWQNQFKYLSCITPCCTQEVTLNDLKYEWLVGFARFVIEIQEGRFLNEAELDEIGVLLGCKLSQIMAHY